jgi:hypothetical protein
VKYIQIYEFYDTVLVLQEYSHRVILRLKKKLLLGELITCLQFVSKRQKQQASNVKFTYMAIAIAQLHVNSDKSD